MPITLTTAQARALAKLAESTNGTLSLHQVVDDPHVQVEVGGAAHHYSIAQDGTATEAGVARQNP